MKKLFFCLFAACAFLACSDSKGKQKPTPDDPETITGTKKKKPASEDDDPLIVTVSPDGDDFKAETRWTSKDRKKFIRQCAQDSPSGLSDEQVASICSCFLSKAEKKYPSYNEAAEEMTEDESAAWMKSCLDD